MRDDTGRRSRSVRGNPIVGALDLKAWNRALSELPQVAPTEADLLAWIEGPLRNFFPFERYYGAYGTVTRHRVERRLQISSGHSTAYLARREPAFDLALRPCVSWWMLNRRAILWDQDYGLDSAGARIAVSHREREDIEQFSLRAVASHGVYDSIGNAGTYVGFSGVRRADPSQTLAALELIAPVLHALYLRTKTAARSLDCATSLTERQNQLVHLALRGLSDKVIAVQLGISEHTVGNHLRAIYARLGIHKRGQLAHHLASA